MPSMIRMRLSNAALLVCALLIVAAIGRPAVAGSVQASLSLANQEELEGLSDVGSVADDNSLTSVPRRPAVSAARRKRLEQWIAELDAAKFGVRERATEQLVRSGLPAIPALAAAADSKNPEVVSRVVRIFKELCVADDALTEELAGLELEKMAESKNALLAQRAAAVLESQSSFRQSRAITKIRALGGIVESYEVWGGDPTAYSVKLGKGWRGGEDGLSHLRWLPSLERLSCAGPSFTDAAMQRLKHLNSLSYLQLYGTRVTDAGEQFLKQIAPGATIDRRDGALLGVSGSAQGLGQGCQIEFVQPGSSADRAGLVRGDVIASFEGQAVGDFPSLTALISRKKPGAKVSLTIERSGQKLEKDVVLGELQLDSLP